MTRKPGVEYFDGYYSRQRLLRGRIWTTRCSGHGENRRILRAKLRTGRGTAVTEQFLVDTGADRTVFTAALLQQLALSVQPAPADDRLLGIGGAAAYVMVDRIIELTRDDGGPAVVRERGPRDRTAWK